MLYEVITKSRGYGSGDDFERIPAFAEVLDRFGKTLHLNVEIKTPFMASLAGPSGPFPERLPLSEAGIDPQVLAANARYVENVAALLAAGPLGEGMNAYRDLIVSSFDPYALASLREIAPEIPLAFLSMPGPFGNFDALAENLLGKSLIAWHPHFNQVDEELVEWHHGKNRRINVWTVNDADSARALAGLGADGIITNSPALILDAFTIN